MEELERREQVEICKADRITQIAVNTCLSAQMLRAMNRNGFVPLAGSLGDDRPDDLYQMAENIYMMINKSSNKCNVIVLE